MNRRHYTKEEKDALIEELVEFREENEKGAHASNKAAVMDMRATLGKIGTEVSQGVGCVVSWLTHISNKFENLTERTGCRAFAFVTRGHVNDTMIPSTLETDDTLSFFNEVLSIAPVEVAQKLEVWSCATKRGNNTHPSHGSSKLMVVLV